MIAATTRLRRVYLYAYIIFLYIIIIHHNCMCVLYIYCNRRVVVTSISLKSRLKKNIGAWIIRIKLCTSNISQCFYPRLSVWNIIISRGATYRKMYKVRLSRDDRYSRRGTRVTIFL